MTNSLGKSKADAMSRMVEVMGRLEFDMFPKDKTTHDHAVSTLINTLNIISAGTRYEPQVKRILASFTIIRRGGHNGKLDIDP